MAQFGTNPQHSSSKPLNYLSFGSKLENPSPISMGRAPLPVTAIAVEKPAATTPEEIVLQPIKEISGTVTLPGSKSLSNRILLLAALSEVGTLFLVIRV